MSATLEDLTAVGERITAEIAEAVRMPRLEAIRQALNETGIRRARAAVTAAPIRIAEAAEALRNAQEAEREAKQRVADEVLNAEWAAEGALIQEGSKWFLVDGETRRPMLAEDRARWKAAEAAKQPAVMAATEKARTASHAVAVARDALATEERRFSAAKADLSGAIAELHALGIGISSHGETR
jgi:hypothetical protein